MNERFIRCSECGMPHEEAVKTCPATGRAIVRAPARSSSAVAAAPRMPAPPPPAPAPPPRNAPPPGSRGAQDAADFELIGSLIGGRYRVRAILGQGGMGTVFEAIREGLGNLVAIKILHPNQLQKKDAVQRFHHEARAAARIGHPNICEVYDVGTLDDGRPYLVMDRLTGVTLAERIQSGGGLPFQDVLDTLTQVLSGLHAAHEKGIIHRDVKPENVFLSQRVGCAPLAKILDFGVSKVMAGSPQASGFSEMEVTRTGVVLGTPYYLAPEQARGERNLDARVDLYACGVMLYEALTGRRPFRAPNYNALLIAILTSTPRPAKELRSDLPAGFQKVIEKAMAREAAERFQTALEFQAVLQPYLHAQVPRTQPPPPPPVRRSGFPPPAEAPPPPNAVESGEDLAAFVESASVEIPVSAPPPPRAPAPAPAPPSAAVRAAALAAQEAKAGRRPRAGPPPSANPTRLHRVPTAVAASAASDAVFDKPTRPFPVPPHAGAPAPAPPRPEPKPESRQARARRGTQNFDDQATEVDIPRRPPGEARRAPVLGPPLQPPARMNDDETSTEIMPEAVKAELPPGKGLERPPVPRPGSTPPHRR